MSEILIAPDTGETFVALSASKRGRLVEKHILSYGELLYPKAKGGKVLIDDAFADRMIANFNAKVCPIVQVPLADDQNRHSEAPDRNIGQVVGLTKRDNKIFATIDIRKHAEDVGETLLGASALFSTDYIDTTSLKTVGPTLLHVAITNRPYINNLDEFRDYSEELIAASADSAEDEVVMLTNSTTTEQEKDMKTLDEAFNYLRDEHNIDVPALQARASEADGVLALSARYADALTEHGFIALSDGETVATPEQILAGIEAASEKIVALSAVITKAEEDAARAAATADVEEQIRKGYILPKQKDVMIALSLSDADTYKALLPDAPLVALSQEQGSDAEPTDDEVAEAEVKRLAAAHITQ